MVTEGRNNYSFNRSCLGGGDDAESLTTVQSSRQILLSGQSQLKTLLDVFCNQFLVELGGRLCIVSADVREGSFLLQRVCCDSTRQFRAAAR